VTVDLTKATYDAEDMAELLSCSTWTVYQHPDAVVPPIHVGRNLRWPGAKVRQGLGIDPS
jgi:hypothetical protein